MKSTIIIFSLVFCSCAGSISKSKDALHRCCVGSAITILSTHRLRDGNTEQWVNTEEEEERVQKFELSNTTTEQPTLIAQSSGSIIGYSYSLEVPPNTFPKRRAFSSTATQAQIFRQYPPVNELFITKGVFEIPYLYYTSNTLTDDVLDDTQVSVRGMPDPKTAQYKKDLRELAQKCRTQEKDRVGVSSYTSYPDSSYWRIRRVLLPQDTLYIGYWCTHKEYRQKLDSVLDCTEEELRQQLR